MKRFIIILAFFALIYSLSPSIKSTAQSIMIVMVGAVAFIVAVSCLIKALNYIIKLSKNDKCKIYQEKEGKITRID
ncbi:hypothetical protein FNI04_22380 [Salmonella enterica subsp. diarizonae]|nr:hypothetical protein [Salmonella enterica subsp. diarizonae]ECJ2856510.1 hypothetical protein [Salmonella enterica subsp. diarizonae]ECJ5852695.1 hypothetical protein [Salmonella enterica subsp. diarizonae]ECQ1024663.1 hypothetical protein [Salmonella enterica subsp. diarizonae]EDT3652778.1 hypothetical protein [Salmonella enterica subsp. diarizonae]